MCVDNKRLTSIFNGLYATAHKLKTGQLNYVVSISFVVYCES